MPTLSAVQLVVLRMVAEGSVRMFCDKCVWHYRDENGDTINRRTMRALADAGMVSFSYPRDAGHVSLTEAGRKRIAEWDRNRRKAA